MNMQLVIVESPTKAKTIGRFLGKDFIVRSSFGHVRDLPTSKIGIDVEHDFEPTYVVPPKAKKIVTELKSLAKKADAILFASDEDREGEAISWHIAHVLGVADSKIKRITFHEITKHAIEHALENPRALDLKLVDAQQARRVLDRLVGYELSPFLWKKVARGLSAGRVQSVAQRLVVERERERRAFIAQDFWTLTAHLEAQSKTIFPAQLVQIDANKPLEKFDLPTQESIDTIVCDLDGAHYTVANITQKTGHRKPQPPFTTSTLQQAANVRLGFSSKQTMMLAQQLYEGIELEEGSIGLITYMRTDSLNLAEQFITQTRAFIAQEFGTASVPSTPRLYHTKSKGAQEAHEAIRPTDATRTPASLKAIMEPRLWRLYDLIWRRAIACQMVDATVAQTNIDIHAASPRKTSYTFRATGQEIQESGFLAVMPAGAKETILPALTKNQTLALDHLEPEQHTTEPPARYSDATLVKAMEEYGIGRPSTYAPTISTIIERNYVERDDQKRLAPTEVGEVVTDALKEHFPAIVDYEFTADMEKQLDEIADGDRAWVPVIRDFYTPFKKNLDAKYKEVSKKDLTEEKTDEVCEKCGKPMIIRLGRFGKFLACSGYPECKNTKPIPGSEGRNSNKPPVPEIPVDQIPDCPKGHGKMEVKRGRFGIFFGCPKYPECKEIINIEESTGVECPQCGKGTIIAKRSKRGRTFFACNKYPTCEFALWNKPTGNTCPTCSSLMVMMKNGETCSNKDCKNT